MSDIRIISLGGGVQSSALIALAATRDPTFERVMGGPVVDAVWSNVGDDSENPDTGPWVRDVLTPWAAERGVTVHEVAKVRRDGEVRTLLQHVEQSKRSLPIPVRMSNGAPGTRSCTVDYKLRVIEKWVKARGATPDAPAAVAIGFSIDELERAGSGKGMPCQDRRYPLLDLRMSRAACSALNVRTWGQDAPRSSCWFCPMHRPAVWAEMRRDQPDLFAASVDLERMLNRRRSELGKDDVYLSRFGKPLDEAVDEAQPALFGAPDGDCDSGGCFT